MTATTTDARELVELHKDKPIHEIGRILVEAGHIDTNYLTPARCIVAYWQRQRDRIERGELVQGCDGPCQPWANCRGRVMCSHSGLLCSGHCDAVVSASREYKSRGETKE